MSLIRNGSEKMTKGLYDFINYLKNYYDVSKMTLLEIGTFNGESTEIFAKEFFSVITVDPYNYELLDNDMKENDLGQGTIQDIENGFVENVMKKYNNVIKVKKTSLEYAEKCKKINRKFDIVYIDGKHDYEFIIEDIKAWLPYCIKAISGHDYLRNKSGVIQAVAEIFQGPDMIFLDHSWVVRLSK